MVKAEMEVMATRIFVFIFDAPSGWHHLTRLCQSNT
jgi:hypothetical protein